MPERKIKSLKEWFSYWLQSKLKFQIARAQVKIKEKRKKILFNRKVEINNMQKSAINFFSAVLKNKESSLNYSPESKTRFIELGPVWITMSSSGDSLYAINIIHENSEDEAHSHEVSIPYEHAVVLMDEFDEEMEKRFKALETTKKKVVVDEIERLLNKINKKKI